MIEKLKNLSWKQFGGLVLIIIIIIAFGFGGFGGGFSTNNQNNILRTSGKRVLETAMRGRVSYIRGETPDKFPMRLYPDITSHPENTIISYSEKKIDGKPFDSNEYQLQFLKLYGTELRDTQLKVYEDELKDIIQTKIGDNPEMTDDIKISQISNISYPVPDSYSINDNYGKNGLLQIFDERDGVYSYKDNSKPILDINHIGNYSSKFKNILESLKNSDGIYLYISYWVEGTIIPLILALEHEGYVHRSKNHSYITIKKEINK